MKISKIGILFIAFLFLFPDHADAGCFTRSDIDFEISKSPDIKCLETNIEKTCLGSVELVIANTCGSAYIYERGGGEKIRITGNYTDPDIPDDFVNWKREFYSENDPDERILMNVRNVRVNPAIAAFLDAPIFFILVILSMIFTFAGVANIFRFYLRKSSSVRRYPPNIENTNMSPDVPHVAAKNVPGGVGPGEVIAITLMGLFGIFIGFVVLIFVYFILSENGVSQGSSVMLGFISFFFVFIFFAGKGRKKIDPK